MSDNTLGIRPSSGSQAMRSTVELLSSMRFAIALLTGLYMVEGKPFTPPVAAAIARPHLWSIP